MFFVFLQRVIAKDEANMKWNSKWAWIFAMAIMVLLCFDQHGGLLDILLRNLRHCTILGTNVCTHLYSLLTIPTCMCHTICF